MTPSHLEKLARELVDKTAKPYGPWSTKDYGGYPCPHCDRNAVEAIKEGARAVLAEALPLIEEAKSKVFPVFPTDYERQNRLRDTLKAFIEKWGDGEKRD